MKRIRKWGAPKRMLAAFLALTVIASSAAGVTLTLWDEADAAEEELIPGTTAYYDARWEEAKVKAGNLPIGTAYTGHDGVVRSTTTEGPWMLDLQEKYDAGTISAPWNGTMTQPTQTASGAAYDISSNPYLVSTAEEFCWCAANHVSFRLTKDIDMGGYLGRNFSRPASSDLAVQYDGNGFTIYNFYQYDELGGASLFGALTSQSSQIANLRIAHSVILQKSGIREAAFFVAGIYASPELTNTSLTNCAAENSYIYSGGDTVSIFASYGGQNSISQCYANTVMVRSPACGGQIVCATGGNITDTFTVNGVTIIVGHGGGFHGCSKGLNIERCFLQGDVYGNMWTGGFSGPTWVGDVVTNNCFSTGKVEGVSVLGGFASGGAQTGNLRGTYTNCYSTMMTGMAKVQGSVGGFIGASDNDAQFTSRNCYAAGEVGDLTILPQEGTVGGFAGDSTKMDFDNCFYDKQTTAMKEQAAGDSATLSGVTGKLTTMSEKSGFGMTDPELAAELGEAYNSDLGEGYYPQLDVFSNPTTFTNTNWMTQDELHSLIKAYSQASVSTVHLNTYDTDYSGNKLPETTYDTVRDLTSQFPLTSAANLGWERCGVTGEATLATGTGAKSSVQFGEGSMDVVQLYEAGGEWYTSQPMPGVDWVRVTTQVGGQTGTRELRICPTVGLDAGLSRYIGDNTPYDHADDVRLVYTTGTRQAMDTGDITYGVFPDSPLASEQEELLRSSAYENLADLEVKYQGQDDTFTDIDVLHMQRTSTELTSAPSATAAGGGLLSMKVYEVEAEDSSGGVQILGPVDLNDTGEANRWNGKVAFADGSEREIYDVEYVWSLADSRYLLDIKRIEYPAHTHQVTIRAENLNQQSISSRVYLDAYSVSTEDGRFDESITHNFGLSPRAQDILSSQSHSYPAATAWQLRYAQDGINGLRICLTTIDANTMSYETAIPGDQLPTAAGQQTAFTLKAPYKSYFYDLDGNLTWRLTEIEKEYTVTLDESGVYNIDFNKEYMDNENGVYVDDLDMDILVTVVLNSTDPPETPETASFVFGNKRVDMPWTSDSAVVVNEMPSLGEAGGGN